MGMGGGAGVPGFDAAGVGGRNESVADSAGDGNVAADGPDGIAMRGEGAAIPLEELDGDDFMGVACGVCKVPGGTPTSTSTEISVSLSRVTVFGSVGVSEDHTFCRNSYRIGEKRTATLAFLWPGRRAIGGRAKLARE